MGKTKTKLIDDSQEVEEVKKPQKPKRVQDDLVEKLKLELGGETASEKRPAQAKVSKDQKETKETKTASEPPKEEKKKKTAQDKSKPRSKKYQVVAENVDKAKTYPLKEAVELVKKLSFTKFEGNLEVHINTIQSGIRGTATLPFGEKTDYKTEAKASVIHLTLGKLGKPSEEMTANITTLLQTIGKTKVRKLSLAPTMGPSVKVDLASL